MPVGKTYWVEENMFGSLLENMDEDKDGVFDFVRFSVKCSFIHAVHPLGFIRDLWVEIDGVRYSPDDTIFVLRKNWIPARYVPTISDIWWNIAEIAHIYVRFPGGISSGEHKVNFHMEISTLFNTRTVDYDNIANRIVMEKQLVLNTPKEGVI